MLKKEIIIDGRPVLFKASAAIPRIYRLQFHRDIFKDLAKLANHLQKNQKSRAQETTGDQEAPGSDIPIEDLELFENAAYVMAKHADPSVPDSIEEWLDEFNTFSIYQVLPEILTLWNLNTATEVENKKKLSRLSGR